MQQISDCELELMKIVWADGGKALYAGIFKDLEQKARRGLKVRQTLLMRRYPHVTL